MKTNVSINPVSGNVTVIYDADEVITGKALTFTGQVTKASDKPSSFNLQIQVDGQFAGSINHPSEGEDNLGLRGDGLTYATQIAGVLADVKLAAVTLFEEELAK